MSKTITKKYVFLEYLGPNIQIEQLQNVDKIKSVIKISDDGNFYEIWRRQNNPLFNSFNQLNTNSFYLINSEEENPNYLLYSESDAVSQERIVSKKIQIFTAGCNLSIANMKNRSSKAFEINQSGDGFLSWDSKNNEQFNSFSVFEQGKSYLLISENERLPYYLYPLFDKTSWETVSEPYKTYLNQAADRWQTYIRYKTSAIDLIKNQYPSWKGLSLDVSQYEEFNDANSDTIAYSGPYEYVDLIQNQAGVEFNSVSFSLGINTRFSSSFDSTDWVNVLTHELGHALGIGIYWDETLETMGAVPPIDKFLDGQSYSKTNDAYNEIIGLVRPKVPLEDSGGGGTSSAHWEDDYRLSSYTGANGLDYPGITNELMVGWYSAGSSFVVSKLSINCLVDFGYEEVEPGNNEGDPIQSTNFRMLNQNMIKLNCKKDFNLKKIN